MPKSAVGRAVVVHVPPVHALRAEGQPLHARWRRRTARRPAARSRRSRSATCWSRRPRSTRSGRTSASAAVTSAAAAGMLSTSSMIDCTLSVGTPVDRVPVHVGAVDVGGVGLQDRGVPVLQVVDPGAGGQAAVHPVVVADLRVRVRGLHRLHVAAGRCWRTTPRCAGWRGCRSPTSRTPRCRSPTAPRPGRRSPTGVTQAAARRPGCPSRS